jgi:hypothetical protein
MRLNNQYHHTQFHKIKNKNSYNNQFSMRKKDNYLKSIKCPYIFHDIIPKLGLKNLLKNSFIKKNYIFLLKKNILKYPLSEINMQLNPNTSNFKFFSKNILSNKITINNNRQIIVKNNENNKMIEKKNKNKEIKDYVKKNYKDKTFKGQKNKETNTKSISDLNNRLILDKNYEKKLSILNQEINEKIFKDFKKINSRWDYMKNKNIEIREVKNIIEDRNLIVNKIENIEEKDKFYDIDEIDMDSEFNYLVFIPLIILIYLYYSNY